jgi:hypothetical protein
VSRALDALRKMIGRRDERRFELAVDARGFSKGDTPGHDFHGNQYSDGAGGGMEEQHAISARLNAQNEREANFQRDSNWSRLMSAQTSGEKNQIVNQMTPAEARVHLARLNAAPGDDPVARQALTMRASAKFTVEHSKDGNKWEPAGHFHEKDIADITARGLAGSGLKTRVTPA